MVPGESVYGEKKVSVDTVSLAEKQNLDSMYTHMYTHTHTHTHTAQPEGEKVEYRVWNPFRSKLAAAILGGVDKIHIKPGSKVLYLGAASGTTVSHVSDIVGPVRYSPHHTHTLHLTHHTPYLPLTHHTHTLHLTHHTH